MKSKMCTPRSFFPSKSPVLLFQRKKKDIVKTNNLITKRQSFLRKLILKSQFI